MLVCYGLQPLGNDALRSQRQGLATRAHDLYALVYSGSEQSGDIGQENGHKIIKTRSQCRQMARL